MDSIFHRTSVRDFLDRPVEPEKVELLLRAAMAAPSAVNQQPWEFYVVTDPELRRGLSECSPFAGCTAGAPLAIVPCYRTKELFHGDYAQIDMSASTENLLLEADSLGLGAVWLGIAPIRERMDRVKALLGLPDELEAFAIIPCGYPDPEKAHVQQDRYDPQRIHHK